jgi:hypothetical protein
VLDARVLQRIHDVVEVAPERHEVRTAPGRGPGELLQHRGARTHLPHDRMGVGQRRHPRAGVRGAERDQRPHPPVAAQPLHVVPRDQPAEAVSHHVHPLAPRALAHLLDMASEQLGRRADVAGQRGVVQRLDLLPAVLGQAAAQQDEDRAVVDEAVQQHDRRLGLRRQLRRPLRGGQCGTVGAAPLLDDAGGIEEDMARQDRQLQCGRLQQAHGEIRQPGRQEAPAEGQERKSCLGDLHGRPPVGTRRDSLVPRVPSWNGAPSAVDGARR